MTTIAFNFEDGVTRIIEAKKGETVVTSAMEARINIPMDCNEGVCGVCKCRIKSGDCDMGDYIDDALTSEEADEGYGLACQIVPKTNMVIEILASSAACKVKAEGFVTTITGLDFLSPEIVRLVLKIKDGRRFKFLAGQYANIELPGSVEHRSYSYSGVSHSGSSEFLIRLLPSGGMSDYIRSEAKVGDHLLVTGPFGGFYLRESKAPILFFAGGTGIAPFLAMLDKLKSEGGAKQPIQLFYGATSDENLVELERLEGYKKILPFDYKTCVSVGKSEKHALGFVTQWVKKAYLGSVAYESYICGPPAMVEAVKAAIAEEGIRLSHFYMEKFLPSGI